MAAYRFSRSFGFSLFFFLLTLSAFADKGESSRVLVHTLNYISHDYQFAVKDGKVISKDEYKEAREFGESAIKAFNVCSTEWSDADSAAIRPYVYKVDSLIEAQAAFEVVSPAAIDAKNRVVAASGLTITPSQYPSIEKGSILYKTECARCHGETGHGDGPDGKILDPKPRDFYDANEMKAISPFSAFNTIRLGVEGTGMKAHETLEDDEVWDLAFYVLSLRHQKEKNNPELKTEAVDAFLDSISLDKRATTSDEDFLKSFTDKSKGDILLAAIRLNQPEQTGSGFIKTSLNYLEGAVELYKQGKFTEASQMATMSYLEGIEPIEMQIKASDPQLMSNLEAQMGHLRKVIAEQRPVSEVLDSVNATKLTIQAASNILDKREYSFWLSFFMALSILLREGLEAFLIIMVILSILKATDLKNATRWVHGGWIVAVLLGVVLWLIGGSLMKSQAQHAELMEGVVSSLAVFMLLYVGFWLHGKSETDKWKDYVKRMMQSNVSSSSLFGLASLSFFVVFREVFESVLFLSALNIESGNKQGNAIAFGIISAFIMVIVFAFVVLRFSARLPIAKLFRVSSLVMGVLAVVLAGKGVHSLQEVGILPIHSLPVGRLELIGLFPTVETCVAQVAVLVVLILIWNVSSSSPEKK